VLVFPVLLAAPPELVLPEAPPELEVFESVLPVLDPPDPPPPVVASLLAESLVLLDPLSELVVPDVVFEDDVVSPDDCVPPEADSALAVLVTRLEPAPFPVAH
jgi:hypothetical protein